MSAAPPGSASQRGSTAGVEIAERPYDHPDAVQLLEALYDEQVGRYGVADPIAADPATFGRPDGVFLVAYVQGVAAACGGYRAHDIDMVEIKKLYTSPQYRSRGLGRQVLSALERRAVGQGTRGAVLESGARNEAALALFNTAGYRPTARYVNGRDPQINRPFFKDLSSLHLSSCPSSATAR